jgi:hypothetical protein
VNFSEPLALFDTLATRLELYTLITDDTFEAMAANYTPRIEALVDEVEALSNKFPISYEDLLDKPVLLQGARGLIGEQGLQGERCLTSDQGLQGERGLTGEQGLQGEQGLPGE